METKTYLWQNICYSITENSEIHRNLLKDEAFFVSYIQDNSGTVEVSIPTQEENNDNFTWNEKTTKLLVAEYKKRKLSFRDPKQKRLTLWREIKELFHVNGYRVSERVLDRKFRNMKHHYKTIVDNNRKGKTGRGAITWEYYDSFMEIFDVDKTINSPRILSSLPSKAPLVSASTSLPSTSATPTSTPVTTETLPSSVPTTKLPMSTLTMPLTISSTTPLTTTNTSPLLSTGMSVSSLDTIEGCNREWNRNKATSSSSSSSSPENATPSSKRKKMKDLREYRKNVLLLEERRVLALEKLAVELEGQNRIQKERNELIKKIIN